MVERSFTMGKRSLVNGGKNQKAKARVKILVGLLRGTQWLYHLEEGGKDRLRREAKSKGLGEKRTLVSYYLFPSSYLNSGKDT